MKIRVKIFLVMLSVVVIMVGGFAITNTVYLEKFYITNKKDKLIQMGNAILDPNYIVDFRNLEMQNNAEIVIKKLDQLDKYYFRRQMSIDEITQIKRLFKQGTPTFKIVNFKDYRGKALVLFMPYKSNRYIEILTPLSLIQEGLDVSVQYHIQIIMLALILGLAIAFVFSKAMVAPILELKEITQKIAKLDFSRKFEGDRVDEIGELGEAINKMGATLKKNIDDINKANSKLMEDIEKEKKLDQLRKEFIAYVSHELKTPIAIIQGYAQGLMENVATEEDKNFYCEVIVDEAYKMDALVKELLLMSKIESGYFKMENTPIDAYPLIKDIIDKYSTSDSEIVYKGDNVVPVIGDEKYLDRVLDNLIGNAVKYSTDDKIVTVTVEDNSDKYKFIISNHSKNLTENDLKNIWTPFIRLDSSIGKEGHGLGLAIVAGILDKHNSKHGVYISEEHTVNFWFELDKAKEDTELEEENEEQAIEDAEEITEIDDSTEEKNGKE